MNTDPRTDRDFVAAAQTVTRTRTPNGPVFRQTTYFVRRSDFDRMAAGKLPERMCYRSIDDGPAKGFKPRATVGAYRKMMTEFNRTQTDHTYGARAMESDWSC